MNIDSYLMRFRKHGDIDIYFYLDMWKIFNFIKTQTTRTKQNSEIGETCELLRKIKKECDAK